MSKASDILLSLAADAAKEAVKWAVNKLREKTRAAGIIVDDGALEDVINAQLAATYTSVRVMADSITSDVEKLAAAERRFRESPNVTVVDDMGEPTELAEADKE